MKALKLGNYILKSNNDVLTSDFGDKIVYDITPQNAKNFIETAQAQYPINSGASIVANYKETGTFPVGNQTTLSGNIQLSYFDGNHIDKSNVSNYMLNNISPNGGRISVVDSIEDTLKSSYIKPTGSVRFIETRPFNYNNNTYYSYTATYNARDIGGWACDGGTIKYGKIYRGAFINVTGDFKTQAKQVWLNELGVKQEIDLITDGVYKTNFPVPYYKHFSVSVQYTSTYPSGYDYDIILKQELQAVFESAKGMPCLIHCSQGCDRTGTLCFYIEAILGMSETDIDIDYELSSLTIDTDETKNVYLRQRTDTVWLNLKAKFNNYAGTTLSDRVINYLLSIGITAKELNEFRSIMCDGTPSIIIAPTVNVLGTYTNCSTSNTSSTTNKYASYTATITADSGYTLEGAVVTITMGGNNITSTAYNNGVIYISEVSGDIIISIEAQNPATNLFDKSDPDVVLRGRFNSSHQVVDYADGQLVTGYIGCSLNDIINLETDRDNKTNGYTGQIQFYDDNKEFILAKSQSAADPSWTWSNDNKEGIITAYNTQHLLDTVAYFRICCAYTDIDNIVITKER